MQARVVINSCTFKLQNNVVMQAISVVKFLQLYQSRKSKVQLFSSVIKLRVFELKHFQIKTFPNKKILQTSNWKSDQCDTRR
jgi:hypothetical protein